jgi:hypothetical protein
MSMRILYRFHGWLIFARVIALFMFVWPYVRLHILCTQLVICLLSHFIHIWYLDWPWSEHVHIIPISRMVDFCESYSPFHVCLTICPFAHLVYATSHLSFVACYSYLVSWLAMIWTCAYCCVHKMCERTYGQTNMKRAITLAKINHPWNRYNMHMFRSWPIKIPNKNNMRQKTND